ncbi:hypothetical protein XENTR_v10004419 [Xenopus tropicalis]|uniref:T-cell antigen CD7-like n=1 Tax=Xenopus tropicalis TaxID=8364 RepID=A0A8J1IYJ3_XENTR|nr:T-cell antigen CD7-like [Xenopus tropicalis]KAE8577073.1 hypothetical protein XENTR_v10004419 [Xenopus tropicalis]
MSLLFLLHFCSFSLVSANCFTENSVIGIRQTPKFAVVLPGGSVSITCQVTSEKDIHGVHLLRRFRKIMYTNKTNTTSKEPDYNQSLLLSGWSRDFTVTLTNLTADDTDIYMCDADPTDSYRKLCGGGTFISVLSAAECPGIGKEQEQSRNEVLLPIYIAVIAVLCLPLLLLAIYKIYGIQLKKATQKLPQNSVYVDMTLTRRNTMSNSNAYNTGLLA